MRLLVQMIALPGSSRVVRALAAAQRIVAGMDADVRILPATRFARADALAAGFDPAAFVGGIGAIGCRMSHIRAWQELLDTPDADIGIVFEDDVSDYSFANAVLTDALRTLPAAFDMLFLGIHPAEHGKPYVQVAPHIARITHGFCTHAYAVSRAGAARLIAAATAKPLEIDTFLHREMAAQRLAAFATVPFLATQASGHSMIWNSGFMFHLNRPYGLDVPPSAETVMVDLTTCSDWMSALATVARARTFQSLHAPASLLLVHANTSSPGAFPFPRWRASQATTRITITPDLAPDMAFIHSVLRSLYASGTTSADASYDAYIALQRPDMHCDPARLGFSDADRDAFLAH